MDSHIKYNWGMSPEIIRTLKFRCPVCNKEFDTVFAEEESICIKSEKYPTEFHGRLVVRQYRDTYVKVRVCKKCHDRRKRNLKIFISLLILAFIIFNIIYGVNYFCNNNNGIGNYVGILFLMLLISPLIMGIPLWIYSKITEIDISSAIKGNAIITY